MVTIYFDTCCLNRPFDDQTQYRIRVESETVLFILDQVKIGELKCVGSEVLDLEIDLIPNLEQKRRVKLLASHISNLIRIEQKEIKRAKQLELLGFRLFDALHIACAESGNIDILLTTDDKLLRLATRFSDKLSIQVKNPLKWLEEVSKK